MRSILGAIILFYTLVLRANAVEWPINYKNKVIETASCASILTVLNDHTIHVQDLDNTIMMPPQMLGSDQWFGDLIAQYMEAGLDERAANEKARALWVEVQKVTPMIPVEDFIPNVITNVIQKLDHVRDVALTARPKELADRTLEQLQALGIDFSKKNPFGGAKEILIESEDFAEPVLIKGGVIFVGPHNDKGKVLAFLLDPANGYNGYGPGLERVVFADDKLYHNENVLREVRSKLPQLEVYAFRDGAADSEVKKYNRVIADFQWKIFKETGQIISDQDAINQLNAPPTAEAILKPSDEISVDQKVIDAFVTGRVSTAQHKGVIVKRNLVVRLFKSKNFEDLLTPGEKAQLHVQPFAYVMYAVLSRVLKMDDPTGKKFSVGMSWPYDQADGMLAGINLETLNWLTQHPEIISAISFYDESAGPRIIRQ